MNDHNEIDSLLLTLNRLREARTILNELLTVGPWTKPSNNFEYINIKLQKVEILARQARESIFGPQPF